MRDWKTLLKTWAEKSHKNFALSPVVFRRVRKLRKAIVSFVMSVRPSVRPHGTTRLPLDGFHEI
jgi:hypothetical protein